jgi:peptidoglycan/xylan/chitin deacetylase (PgdA/CDA1 family)
VNVFRTPGFLKWFYPDLVWRITTTEREVFLTFDDGPIPGVTEFVLNTLREHQALATFFCIGDNVRKHPDIFNMIVSDKHAIGNHTYNHIKGWNSSTTAYIENVMLCDELIGSRQQGKKIFRPPYGRIKKSQIKELRQEYNIIMWDVLTHDYAQSISPEQCLAGSLKAVRPGSIIVFHDSLKAERNVKFVLPRLLNELTKQGYKFSELRF